MRNRRKGLAKALALVILLSMGIGLSGLASAQQPDELIVAFPVLAGTYQDIELVQEEINKIALEKINAKVKLHFMGLGAYVQQTMLMLSGNEQIDLMLAVGALPVLHAQGQLLPLNGLLNDYGAEIVDLVGADLLQATTFGGEIKGIPPIRCYAGGIGLTMRKDILDKYSTTAEELQAQVDAEDNLVAKLEVFEELFAKVKEDYPGMAPLVPGFPGTGVLSPAVYQVNVIGSENFAVLKDRESLELVNYYETDEYRQVVQKAREWNQKGYIMRGSEINQEPFEMLIRSERGFSGLRTAEPGTARQTSLMAGFELVDVVIVPPHIDTLAMQATAWVIPRTSENPDKAMQLLNLMYTSPELMNLLAYGIEDKHHRLDSNGKVAMIENAGYDLSIMSPFFGNQFILHLQISDADDYYEQLQRYNDEAPRPKSLGFMFDSTPVRTELAALTAIREEFTLALETGVVNPDDILPEFIRRLKSAGIDAVVAEAQRQLDDWAK